MGGVTAVARYWRTARDALDAERLHLRNLARTDEVDFLPAALEVIQTPVSPTARALVWSSLIALALILAWMTIGEVDIVASANGRIVPGDDVKLIQSPQPGVVRAILVRDDQVVKAGQPLVLLDPTISGAEIEQAREALRAAQLDVVRTEAVLSALDGHALVLAAPSGTSADVLAAQTALARDTLSNIRDGEAVRLAERRSAIAAAAEAQGQITKFDRTLPMLDAEIAVYEQLLSKGFVAKVKVLEIRRQRLAAGTDREIALATARKAVAQTEAAVAAAGQVRSDARSRLLSDLVKASAEVEQRSRELAKATERSRLQRLVSPVDGTVVQLAVHTIGGVVEVAKPLMVVVPARTRVRAEVQVLNKDIGFVRIGQPVVIKLSAFPFTRFGVVTGHVESVAADAVADPKLGLMFPARVALDPPTPRSGKDPLRLVPGLEAIADIKTGRRTILSFLLSPLAEARQKAARER